MESESLNWSTLVKMKHNQSNISTCFFHQSSITLKIFILKIDQSEINSVYYSHVLRSESK